jgi:hypothetical protein
MEPGSQHPDALAAPGGRSRESQSGFTAIVRPHPLRRSRAEFRFGLGACLEESSRVTPAPGGRPLAWLAARAVDWRRAQRPRSRRQSGRTSEGVMRT